MGGVFLVTMCASESEHNRERVIGHQKENCGKANRTGISNTAKATRLGPYSESRGGDTALECVHNDFEDIQEKQLSIEVFRNMQSLEEEEEETTSLNVCCNESSNTKSSNDLDWLLNQIGFGYFQWRLLVLCGMGYFAVCAELLMIVFLFEPLQLDEGFSKGDLSSLRYAWLPFSTTLSSAVSGLLFARLSDPSSSKHATLNWLSGRQKPFIMSAFITGGFGLLCCFAADFPMLVTLRAIAAIGLGGFTALDFVLFAECCPSRSRGPWLVCVTLFGAFGVLFVTGMAWIWLPSAATNPNNWRYFIAICALPTIVVFLMRLAIADESPYYLLKQNKHQELYEVLKKMARLNKVPSPELEVSSNISHNYEIPSPKSPLAELLLEGKWKLTVPLWGIWFFLALGYWGVTIFLPTYFLEIGLNPYETFFVMVAAEVPSLLFTMALMRSSYFAGVTIQNRVTLIAVYEALTALMLIPFIVQNASSHSISNAALVAFAALLYAFMIPIWGLVNTLTPEIYPTHLRANGVAASAFVSAIPGLITGFLSSSILSSPLVWLYPMVWSIVFLLGLACCVFLRIGTIRHSFQQAMLH